MKKTVKVLFSLVLVCLFAFQFAGAMPTSASAERIDSKWNDIALGLKYYALDSNGNYYELSGDELGDASISFVGDDVGEDQPTVGDFLNGTFNIVPPAGYYIKDMFICADGIDAMNEHISLTKYASAAKDSAKLSIARGALANKDGDINTELITTADGSAYYIMKVLLGTISDDEVPTISYNAGWLSDKIAEQSFEAKLGDGGFSHEIISDYAAYTGRETYTGMTLTYENGASVDVQPGDIIKPYSNATVTANYVVKFTVGANDASYVYGEAVPSLGIYVDPAADVLYTLTADTQLGTPNADGTTPINVTNVVVTDAAGNALGDDKLDITVVPGTLSVTKRNVTISAKDVSSEYTGSPINANDFSADGLLDGDYVDSVSYSGGPTFAGSGSSTPSNAVIKNANGEDVTAFYNISYTAANVTVTAYSGEVTIKADDASKTYDGTKLTASGATATGLREGDKLEDVVVSGEALVPGTDGVAKVDSYVIKNANGEVVTGNYANLKTVDGKLTVTQREITVTTGSAKKEYDKTPLTTKADDYKVTSGSLVDGQTLSLTLNGTITDPGTAKNTVKDGSIKITDAQGRDYTAYYKVSVVPGDLEITGKKVIAIKVKAASAEKTYDGEPLTASNVEVVEGKLDDGDTLVADITASITNAGSTANKINKVTIKDASGKDVTGKYTITTEDGTLTVTKRALKITAKSAEKVYDGKALTANSCEVSNNLVKGHNISVTVTGTQTQIGSSKNKASNAKIVDSNKNDVTGNYDITYVDGTLTVKAANAKPKTGDDANMGLWIGLMAVSAVVIAGGVVFFVKRSKKNNEQ